MPEYRMRYEIDVVADSPTQAARVAWKLICGQFTDPAALPPIFEVQAADDQVATSLLIELARGGRARRLPRTKT